MPACTVHGSWRHASSSADVDLEGQTITGAHTSFTLPITPEPARAAAAPNRTPQTATTDAIDDFFGVTRQRATRESQHDSRPSLGSDISPPPYADAELPAYSANPNTEPTTLAKYLFKFGFCMCHSRLALAALGCLTLFCRCLLFTQCSHRFGPLAQSP